MLVKIFSNKNLFSLSLGIIGPLLVLFFNLLPKEPSLKDLLALLALSLSILLGITYLLRSTYFKRNLFGLFLFSGFFMGLANLDLKLNLSLLLSILLIMAMNKSSQYNEKNLTGFDIGFILALLTILLPFQISFLAFIVLFSFSTRKHYLSNVFIVLLIVFLILIQLHYLFEWEFALRHHLLLNRFNFMCLDSSFLLLIIPCLIFLLAGGYLRNKHQLLTSHNQITLKLNSFFLLNLLILFLFVYGNQHENLILLALPYSIIVGKYLEMSQSKITKEIILWLFLLSMLLLRNLDYFTAFLYSSKLISPAL